ncbi:hypothetical protein ACVWWJ_001134 [Luteibacter sp. HA06]|jgi:hypothetical protein
MRVYGRAAAAVLVFAGSCQPAAAMTRDVTSVAGVTILNVSNDDDLVEVELKIEESLDEGQRVALTGPLSMLGVLKPDDVYAWPATNTIVLDPGAGLGIFGFNATDLANRHAVLSRWNWSDRAEVDTGLRPVRSANTSTRSIDVSFDLSAATPSSVCRAFRRKMTSTVFGQRVPPHDEFRVFARELRRWCQYGNLSVHTAALPQFTIAPYRATDEPRLSLVTEWALLRNSDPIDLRGTTFLFWAKTVGEGGGSGFGRREGTEGYFDAAQGGLRRLLDASIHSGWGPIEYDGRVSAWPIDSSFPGTGKTGLFVCDEPDGEELFGCPRQPRLRTLYPADSIDGKVSVSRAERFIVGGNAQAGVSIDSTGKVTPSMTFSLNLIRSTTETAQSEMHLVQTRSNTGVTFYRSTRWTPDVPAIYRWINARAHHGSLVQATPLAGTLNPQYEIVWELPLSGNEGRKLSYNVIYEAGWNTCFNGPNCTGHVQPPDRTLQSKGRVGWKDRLKLVIPYS